MISAQQVLKRYHDEDLAEFLDMDSNDVNQRLASGDYPIHVASVRGVTEEVEALIAAGANVNAAGDLSKQPIHYAIGLGHAEVVELLLKAGANLDVVNDFGMNARDKAKEIGNPEILRLIEIYDKSKRQEP